MASFPLLAMVACWAPSVFSGSSIWYTTWGISLRYTSSQLVSCTGDLVFAAPKAEALGTYMAALSCHFAFGCTIYTMSRSDGLNVDLYDSETPCERYAHKISRLQLLYESCPHNRVSMLGQSEAVHVEGEWHILLTGLTSWCRAATISLSRVSLAVWKALCSASGGSPKLLIECFPYLCCRRQGLCTTILL